MSQSPPQTTITNPAVMSTEQHSSLPAGLAGVLNRPDEQRDSAYYSNMDASSKHTSVQSANGNNVLTPPSTYQSSTADHTPSPINTSMLNQPLPSPGSMSVASMVSPTADQSMLRRLDRQSYESGTVSAGLHNYDADSRRQSVNSTVAQGLGELRLASSPYASNNQSTTSIQSTLQQQRNPGGAERNSLGRFYSNGQTTPAQRTSIPMSLPDPISPKGPRAPIIAPAITGPAQGSIARAPEAIPGQAWAFPEEPIQQLNSRARPSAEPINRQGTSFLDSRRSSFAESIASSQYTTESRYPPGQRRLEEGVPGQDYQRLSRASSELQNVSTHHHSLQHKQVSDLQSESGSPSSSQPYSRTPELRVSHKLAERKRRTEMKDLFDQLRDLMPQERGSKASKWEILTKAIAEYTRLKETLEKDRIKMTTITKERDDLYRECNNMRVENAQLRGEMARMTGGAGYRGDHVNREHERMIDPNHPHYQGSARIPPSEQLPPLRMQSGPSSESMNGIQYQNAPRVGYHQF